MEEFMEILQKVINEQAKKAPSQSRAVEEFIWRVTGKLLFRNIPPTPENFKGVLLEYLSVFPRDFVDFKFEVMRIVDLAMTEYMNSRLPLPA